MKVNLNTFLSNKKNGKLQEGGTKRKGYPILVLSRHASSVVLLRIDRKNERIKRNNFIDDWKKYEPAEIITKI